MKKIVLVLIVVFLSSLAYLSLNYNLEFTSPDSLDSENSYVLDKDIGLVSMGDGIKKINFKYKNNGEGNLTINQLYTSCMCTKAKLVIGDLESSFAGMKGHKSGLMPINPDIELKPGETADVFVEFDPNAHGPNATGPITRSVFLGVDNQKDLVEFTFSGDVIK